jgi:hypothetical protein
MKKKQNIAYGIFAVMFALAFTACSGSEDEGQNWSPNVGGSPTYLSEDQWSGGNVPNYSSGGEKWFRFTASASAQYIHVSFKSLDSLYLQIYDGRGSTVNINWAENSTGSSNNNSTTGNYYDSSNIYSGYVNKDDISHSLTASLTSGGTYYIRVWPYVSDSSYLQGTKSTSGSFRVAFNKSINLPISSSYSGSSWSPTSSNNNSTTTQLTENQWANGSISYNSKEWFKFTSTSGSLSSTSSSNNSTTYTQSTQSTQQYIHVSTDSSSQNSLYIQLYDSNGYTVGGKTLIDSSTRFISKLLAPDSTYYINVWPNDSSSGSSNFSYQIGFNTSNTTPTTVSSGGGTSLNDAIQLTVNQWANGNISSSGGQQWFTFTATASTQYIHVVFGTLTDLYVQVYNSNDSTVGSSTNMYSSTRYTSRSLTSGQRYYIKVWPYSGSGTYQIAFNTSSTPPSTSGGGHDIDSSLYGTWSTSNNVLTVTFSSSGVTWGGTSGSALNIQGATWTAKNGTIYYTANGTSTTAYNYTLSSGNLILSTVVGGTSLTLTKQ